jgi:hypothetical protein
MAEPPKRRLFQSQRDRHGTVLNWNIDPIEEFCCYARAFHEAAKALVQALDLDQSPHCDWNACPVVFLYRHSAELYLKGIVLGDGANFLLSTPDPARILKEHSLKKLFALIREIFKVVDWRAFECEGFSDIGSLESLILELDGVDPGSHAFRYPVNTKGHGSVKRHFNFSVLEFASRMDPALECLDTVDFGLAAEWEVRGGA